MLNCLQHEQFLKGAVTTDFIFQNPDLLDIKPTRNRAHKLSYYLASTIVNGPCTPLATDLLPSKIDPHVPSVSFLFRVFDILNDDLFID